MEHAVNDCEDGEGGRRGVGAWENLVGFKIARESRDIVLSGRVGILKIFKAFACPGGDGKDCFLSLVEGGEIGIAVGNRSSVDLDVRWDAVAK